MLISAAAFIARCAYSPANDVIAEVSDSGVLGTTVHNPDLSLNPYVLSWANDTASSNYTNNGKIVTLKFSVASNAKEGNYPVTISYDNNNDDIVNMDMSPVFFAVSNGAITVKNSVCGDVNGDGKVTSVDRAFIARYLAKWSGYDSTKLDLTAADVNEDGKVTATEE